jgi:hypothetical protein
VLCPYCLSETPKSPCQSCGKKLPPLYVDKVGGRLGRKPLIIPLIGPTAHGKSIFLIALMHVLRTQVPRIWEKFFIQGLDTESIRFVQQGANDVLSGRLPMATKIRLPRPTLHTLANIPGYGSKTVCVYDLPGEIFLSDTSIESYFPFIKQSASALFIISPPDLADPKQDSLLKLLNAYIAGVVRLGGKTRDQSLIIAFSKAYRYPQIYRTMLLMNWGRLGLSI